MGTDQAEAWARLRQYFEHDDGSLPEICVSNVDSDEVRRIFVMVWTRGHDVTAHGGASYWDHRDDRDKPLSDPDAVARLAAAGEGTISAVVGGIEGAGAIIPDLGLHVYRDEICFDYRMGHGWGPRQLKALLELLADIVRLAPAAEVRLCGPNPRADEPGDRLRSTGDTWSVEPASSRRHHEEA